MEGERSSVVTIRGVLEMLNQYVAAGERSKPVIPLGNGDPSNFPSFRSPIAAEDAIVDALRCGGFNSYAPKGGLLSARSAVADYLSADLPHRLSVDDVHLTVGCTQAMLIALESLLRPGANILLPRPGFPNYEAFCASFNLEVRHFNLLPERGWEVDLDGVEALADQNTVAIVVINPGNPCGNVYNRHHLHKIAEKARKLGIPVIADEVYGRLAFGSTPFVPMAVFGSVVPVVTLGSISKRWCAPGWRLGWIVLNDPNHVLKNSGFPKKIVDCLNISVDPTTFLQGALPSILQNTDEAYFSKIIGLLRETANTCFTAIEEIRCITCPNKPEGSMFVMAKLNVGLLDDVADDMDFCQKLAKEERVVIVPGVVLGMKNWLRMTFATEPAILEDGLERLKAFCERHSKRL